MHDTRIGRFWSVDPLAGKFPWNSVYAFAENSPVGFLELEGLEKVQFGIDVVNFTGKTKEEVKALLRKYKQYHRGNLSVKEIMSSANDKETWEVLDMTDVYLNSTGTKVKKITKNGVFEEVRRSGSQRLYHWDECLEGRSDGANQGTMTTKDLVVGFGFFCAITSLGALVEAGASAEVIIGLVNSIDDAFGVFTNGSGSLSQDLTPEQAKVVTNSLKTILSAITTAKGHYNLKKKGAKTEPETKIKTKKALDYLNSILNFLDLTSKTYGTVKDEKDKNDAKKQKAKQE
jgi:hypothetical protein